jgi:uncharacterized protein
MINLQPLLLQIAAQYTLDPQGLHGLNHWARVLENGLKLSDAEGGDTNVIRLFAIFHDACRLNQAQDPGHGARGAALAEKILGDLSLVTRKQLELLKLACAEHTDGKTTADLTIQICWDSDRLDLYRAYIRPHPDRLCTNTAKSNKLINWANQRAYDNHSPPYVKSEWEPIFARVNKTS